VGRDHVGHADIGARGDVSREALRCRGALLDRVLMIEVRRGRPGVDEPCEPATAHEVSEHDDAVLEVDDHRARSVAACVHHLPRNAVSAEVERRVPRHHELGLQRGKGRRDEELHEDRLEVGCEQSAVITGAQHACVALVNEHRNPELLKGARVSRIVRVGVS
jgi:hypothetical protein